MKGFCENPDCRKPIEWKYKTRQYCRPSCCQKMRRERKALKEQEQKEKSQVQLTTRWKRLHPYVVEILKTILDKSGLEAAQQATKAVEVQRRFD